MEAQSQIMIQTPRLHPDLFGEPRLVLVFLTSSFSFRFANLIISSTRENHLKFEFEIELREVGENPDSSGPSTARGMCYRFPFVYLSSCVPVININININSILVTLLEIF